MTGPVQRWWWPSIDTLAIIVSLTVIGVVFWMMAP
jgi:hypothetical protein